MSACPRLRMGVLVANLLSPAEQQESGKCGLISPMQVSSLTSKKYDEAARVSEQLMDAMRNATQNVGVDCSKELGRTDARIVSHLLGIGAKSADRRAFTTLDEIATQFADGIAKLSGKPNGQSFYNNELRKAMKAIGPKLQTPIAEKKRRLKPLKRLCRRMRRLPRRLLLKQRVGHFKCASGVLTWMCASQIGNGSRNVGTTNCQCSRL